MSKSNRNYDHSVEQIICKVSIEILKQNVKDIEIIETNSVESQLRGSDFLIKSKLIFQDDKFHVCDFKAASDYSVQVGKDPLPTFAFELASLQENHEYKLLELRRGWFFPDSEYHSNTEYYVLQWIFLKDKKLGITEENISEIQYEFVDKEKLQNLILNLDQNLTTRLENNFNINSYKPFRPDSILKYHHFLKKVYNNYNKEDKFNKETSFNITHLKYSPLNFKIKNGRLYFSNLSISDVRFGGPILCFTADIIKPEQPLNFVIARTPYLKNCSIHSKTYKRNSQ
ncbi:TPA: hypothetical protein U1333_000276 [Streptococcus suis]|nr:hypothetical protein [Streptococcus suis]